MATTSTPAFTGNQTCDVYRGSNVPPNPADVAGVALYLEEQWTNIKPGGTGYTHVVHVAIGVDIRDNDKLYVPSGSASNAVIYTVQFVARRGKGTILDHKVAYVQRGTANWPTDNV